MPIHPLPIFKKNIIIKSKFPVGVPWHPNLFHYYHWKVAAIINVVPAWDWERVRENNRKTKIEKRERGRKDYCKNRTEAFMTITKTGVHSFSHILDGT